jgi:hypothetical protein
MYHRPDGSAQPIIRMHGTVLATMEQLAHMEAVLGDYGGQLASFEWVFSPRGPDGRPLQMFNRTTGAVDPQWLSTGEITTTSPTVLKPIGPFSHRISKARFISLSAPTTPSISMGQLTGCNPCWID